MALVLWVKSRDWAPYRLCVAPAHKHGQPDEQRGPCDPRSPLPAPSLPGSAPGHRSGPDSQSAPPAAAPVSDGQSNSQSESQPRHVHSTRAAFQAQINYKIW